MTGLDLRSLRRGELKPLADLVEHLKSSTRCITCTPPTTSDRRATPAPSGPSSSRSTVSPTRDGRYCPTPTHTPRRRSRLTPRTAP
jgi:hypothetical protein